ncbi:hypothetical protein P4C99_09855 [Pontiellaceae bacterium B1224]|nr:hypothetical protein [Pontiellaceae bacterium B1224]
MLRLLRIIVSACLITFSTNALWEMYETGELLEIYNPAPKANLLLTINTRSSMPESIRPLFMPPLKPQMSGGCVPVVILQESRSTESKANKSNEVNPV